MSVPHAVITTAAKSWPPKLETTAAWALIGFVLRARSSHMDTSTPRGFCGAGRRRAKGVARTTGEPFDEPAMQKPPALKGCARAGARFVATLDRCYRIALR